MKAIDDWFNNGMDYQKGVSIYEALPNAKATVLKSLKKRKNNYNRSLLVRYLRQAKVNPPRVTKKSDKKPQPPRKPITQEHITKTNEQKRLKEQSAKIEYGSITYASLPAELRVRYQHARNLFYEMCELKFLLNEVPKYDANAALKLQLQIEDLDHERMLVWKELQHWKNHKTMLPVEADVLETLTPAQLVQKKLNLKSAITKQTKRNDGWYDQLDEATDTKDIRSLELKINKGEKALHQHQLNINKIESLLK